MAMINIPNPCSEDFSKMSPVQQGFHCESCQKVVVDFTDKSDAEIASFLEQNRGRKTCGRFRISQVVKHQTFAFHIVRFAAAVLLAFGSFLFTGCKDPEPKVMGEICNPNDSIQMIEQMLKAKVDSTRMADSLSVHASQTDSAAGK